MNVVAKIVAKKSPQMAGR